MGPPFPQTAVGRPKSCLGSTGPDIPPKAVHTQAHPLCLQAQDRLLFTAKSSLSTFPTPAASLFVPPHPSPGREWAEEGGLGGEGGRSGALAAGWVPGMGVDWLATGSCILDGCSQGVSSLLLPLVPSPFSLCSSLKHKLLLLAPSFAGSPAVGISRPVLAVNGNLSQEDTSKPRKEGSGANPHSLYFPGLHQPESLLHTFSLFLP